MAELYLSYEGEDSNTERVKVEGERFSVGRHSENDLSIRDPRLSRFHLKIDRFADVYVASDQGSSNGTKLNGVELSEPQALADGDILDLGGLKMEVELGIKGESSGFSEAQAEPPAPEPEPAARPAAAAQEPAGAGLQKLFIIAPIIAFTMLVLVGGGILVYSLASGDSEDEDDYPTPFDDIAYSTPDSDTDALSTPTISSSPGLEAGSPEVSPAASPSGEMAEEERLRNLVTEFMREIAQRDASPVITSEPLGLIKQRTDRMKGNASVASNIKSAASSRAQIEALARSKNLQPEFVAGAALAKLGTSRGDVAATAAGMIDVLSKLKIQIGDAFANECAIIVAAYDQGERGQFLEMRDTMTKLTTDNPNVSSRKVRTIWYLREQGKLSDAQFEFALRFLAVGAISRDPKAFGVDAEPLKFS